MKGKYAGPWAYTQGNERNPYNGEIRSTSGELLNLRAVMNDEDAAVMRLMAAAPDLHDALRRIVREFDCGRTPLAADIEAARQALKKADGE